METIWQATLHTPWWVYLLLMYLITIGLKASKTRVVALHKLFILPIIFTIWSVYSLVTDLKISIFSLGNLIIAILTGIFLGWIFVMRSDVKIDKKRRLIEMPGTWSILLIILIIFASKYYFGYQLATTQFLSEDVVFQCWMLGISGLCVGLFVGRLLSFLNRSRFDGHVDLEK